MTRFTHTVKRRRIKALNLRLDTHGLTYEDVQHVFRGKSGRRVSRDYVVRVLSERCYVSELQLTRLERAIVQLIKRKKASSSWDGRAKGES